MLSFLRPVSVLFLLLCLGVSAMADTALVDPFHCVSELSKGDKERLITKIQDRYRSISTLSAEFSQRSLFAGLAREEASNGLVVFKKPGNMDWQYQAPEVQRFVADGHTLWYYQPELNQVTISQFEGAFNSELPVSFLLGVGKLSESFKLVSACTVDLGSPGALGVAGEFQPLKEDRSLQRFFLLVDKDSAVKGARIIDVGGNINTIVFDKVIFNSEVADGRFAFEIPKGVDPIDMRSGVAPVERQNLTEENLISEDAGSKEQFLQDNSAKAKGANGGS